MSTKPKTFRDLIDQHFGGVKGAAEALGVSEYAAKKMRDRRSIGFEYWPSLVEITARGGLTLTDADLRAMRRHKQIEKRKRKSAPEREGAA